jgi:hypothetical protein
MWQPPLFSGNIVTTFLILKMHHSQHFPFFSHQRNHMLYHHGLKPLCSGWTELSIATIAISQVNTRGQQSQYVPSFGKLAFHHQQENTSCATWLSSDLLVENKQTNKKNNGELERVSKTTKDKNQRSPPSPRPLISGPCPRAYKRPQGSTMRSWGVLLSPGASNSFWAPSLSTKGPK